jgi:hypothetical protein
MAFTPCRNRAKSVTVSSKFFSGFLQNSKQTENKHCENESSRIFQNIGTSLPDHTASHTLNSNLDNTVRIEKNLLALQKSKPYFLVIQPVAQLSYQLVL